MALGLDLVVADVPELGRAVVVDGFNADNLKTKVNRDCRRNEKDRAKRLELNRNVTVTYQCFFA